jgi:hypothetical protein
MSFRPPVEWAWLDDDVRRASWANEDFCEIRFSADEIDRFIRCILPLPVPRLQSEFRFGVWVSVSDRSWDVYRRGFDSGDYAQDGCFGYLADKIPEYPSSSMLHANVWFANGGQRPTVELQDADHSLVRAQRTGIDVAQIERWVASTHSG